MRDNNQEFDQGPAENGEGEGFDFERLKETAGFVLRAPMRRPVLAATAFVTVAALGLTVAATLPRTYLAQVKLLAQRNLVLPALSNPNRTVPVEADEPTRDVANLIMRHDNLVSLVKEANLADRFDKARSPALRLKDRLLDLASAPQTQAEKLRSLVGTLEKRLSVTSDESSLTIAVYWNDPQMAYDIATLVQKHFVEARYNSEVAMIKDAIAVLEDHEKTELEQVDSTLADYEKLRAARMAGVPSADLVATSRTASGGQAAQRIPVAAGEDLSVTKALEEKRRQIRALEDERQREIDTLKLQLGQAQLTLAPMHPTVMGLQERIGELGQPSADIERRKKEERALMAEIAAEVPVAAPSAGGSPSSAVVMAVGASPAQRAESRTAASIREDPSLAPARERLESAIHSYQDVAARIDAAKLELDISRTAFRYRYSVITPAEVPRAPNKPVGMLIGVASVVGALIAALLSATIADLMRGRVLESWQIRRRFKLEILGEFEPPA